MGNGTNPFAFGRVLVKTNDLDPVYNVVWKAKLRGPILRRWLLAYWCFYHVGTASWVVDQPDYWKAMQQAAGSKEWPRGSERRHFRGSRSTRAVQELESVGITAIFDPLIGRRLTLEDVMGQVKAWHGFGDWIAFKVADMLERLALAKVSFTAGPVFMFDSPRKGAEELWGRYGKDVEPDHKGVWAVKEILKRLNPLKAPPRYERLLGVQEAETVLCKWKSHLSGHYRLGEDLEAVESALKLFSQTKTAQKLLRAGKREGLWKTL